MKFRFITGRQYQPKGHPFEGQVIDVEVREGALRFWDRSRNIDGAFTVSTQKRTQRQIEDMLMRRYDRNEYQPLDSFESLLHTAYARKALKGEQS